MYLWTLLILFVPLFVARGPYSSLGDIFQHQLANLPDEPPYKKPPGSGGADYDYCCLKAVNESLEIRNGYLEFRPGQTHLRGTASDFLRYQFPCDAAYNGSIGSPSQVFISYTWCHENCPGWIVAGTYHDDLSDWLRQLVVFVVPSVVFCLAIVRRRRLVLPQALFPRRISTLLEALALIYLIPLASILVTLDTVLWLVMVMMMAGPMIVSGILEAVLDFRVLKFVQKKTKVNSMTVRERAHLLLLVLIGDLEPHPTWEHSRWFVEHLPHDSLRSRFSSNFTSIGSDMTLLSPLATRPTNGAASEASPPSGRGASMKKQYPDNVKVHICGAKSQLKCLLDAQVGFGSSVGAAVVFYTVSFTYSLIELIGNLGSSSAAHSIAFGIFWMVVPHVAIVSSLLLASNNPSAWAAAIATEKRVDLLSSPIFRATQIFRPDDIQSTDPHPHRVIKTMRAIKDFLFPCVYETTYTPAWLWNRGESKSRWCQKYIEAYPKMRNIREEVLKMDSETCFNILAPASFLLIAPPFMAGMISYTTPSTGLSCRSMTHLVYAAAQTLLSILWLYKLACRQRTAVSAPRISRISGYTGLCLDVMWYFLFILGLAGAFFTSIIGTTFDLVGLHNNCLCYIPVWYWASRYTNPEAEFYASGDSIERNRNARIFWIPIGVSATALLIAMSYVGWWYQRHHREQFHHLADNIDHVNEEDINENEERLV